MIDVVKVKGKSEVVTIVILNGLWILGFFHHVFRKRMKDHYIYEIYDVNSPETIMLKDKTREDFEDGFVLYHRKEFIAIPD